MPNFTVLPYGKYSGPSHGFPQKFVATAENLAYYVGSFGRLFWGEQPPFTPFGRGGRYFFNDEFPMSNDEGMSRPHSAFVIRH
jgi:hypothetical protein